MATLCTRLGHVYLSISDTSVSERVVVRDLATLCTSLGHVYLSISDTSVSERVVVRDLATLCTRLGRSDSVTSSSSTPSSRIVLEIGITREVANVHCVKSNVFPSQSVTGID